MLFDSTWINTLRTLLIVSSLYCYNHAHNKYTYHCLLFSLTNYRRAYTCDLLSASKSTTSTTMEHGLANKRMPLQIKHYLMLLGVLSPILFSCHKITMVDNWLNRRSSFTIYDLINTKNVLCKVTCSFVVLLLCFPFSVPQLSFLTTQCHIWYYHLLRTGHQNLNYNPITEKSIILLGK